MKYLNTIIEILYLLKCFTLLDANEFWEPSRLSKIYTKLKLTKFDRPDNYWKAIYQCFPLFNVWRY